MFRHPVADWHVSAEAPRVCSRAKRRAETARRRLLNLHLAAPRHTAVAGLAPPAACLSGPARQRPRASGAAMALSRATRDAGLMRCAATKRQTGLGIGPSAARARTAGMSRRAWPAPALADARAAPAPVAKMGARRPSTAAAPCAAPAKTRARTHGQIVLEALALCRLRVLRGFCEALPKAAVRHHEGIGENRSAAH
jgi:hypothetical protein